MADEKKSREVGYDHLYDMKFEEFEDFPKGCGNDACYCDGSCEGEDREETSFRKRAGKAHEGEEAVEDEKYKKELDGTIYTRKDEVEAYVELRRGGMAEVGAIEALNSFGQKELAAILRFHRLYGHYFGDSDKASDISLKLDVDISEALTGLKAVQREARKATQSLAELKAVQERDGREAINDLRDIQGYDGNWNYSEYMRGLYNGLELASATLEGRVAEYKEKPSTYVELNGEEVAKVVEESGDDLSHT